MGVGSRPIKNGLARAGVWTGAIAALSLGAAACGGVSVGAVLGHGSSSTTTSTTSTLPVFSTTNAGATTPAASSATVPSQSLSTALTDSGILGYWTDGDGSAVTYVRSDGASRFNYADLSDPSCDNSCSEATAARHNIDYQLTSASGRTATGEVTADSNPATGDPVGSRVTITADGSQSAELTFAASGHTYQLTNHQADSPGPLNDTPAHPAASSSSNQLLGSWGDPAPGTQSVEIEAGPDYATGTFNYPGPNGASGPNDTMSFNITSYSSDGSSAVGSVTSADDPATADPIGSTVNLSLDGSNDLTITFASGNSYTLTPN